MENNDVWEESIAINNSDGLMPSTDLKNLIEEEKKGNITTKEIIEKLKELYHE